MRQRKRRSLLCTMLENNYNPVQRCTTMLHPLPDKQNVYWCALDCTAQYVHYKRERERTQCAPVHAWQLFCLADVSPATEAEAMYAATIKTTALRNDTLNSRYPTQHGNSQGRRKFSPVNCRAVLFSALLSSTAQWYLNIFPCMGSAVALSPISHRHCWHASGTPALFDI